MGQFMSADRAQKTMPCPGAPVPPLEDDNILSMILCRLPRLPSSLPRVSLVCKRWRRLVTDPYFHRLFLAHHKKAPLLGFFFDFNGRVGFRPTLDPPNCFFGPRFSSQQLGSDHIILGCHHGRLLLLNFRDLHFVVWDPITRDHRHLDIPQVFKGKEDSLLNGAAVCVCASQEKGHVHGACHTEPYQVVLIGSNREGAFACVHSSDAGTWGSLISLQRQMPDITIRTVPLDCCETSLVGNCIYWVPVGIKDAALEFDLHKQTLAIIDAPPEAFNFIEPSIQHEHQSFIVPADGGGLSFIVLSGFSVHVWKRISNGHGVAAWVFKNTVELSSLLSLKPSDDGPSRIVGLDEDDNVIFRLPDNRVLYMVHLETLQFKQTNPGIGYRASHSFSSFYTAGMHPETGMHGDENA